jgi:hypothetical protein
MLTNDELRSRFLVYSRFFYCAVVVSAGVGESVAGVLLGAMEGVPGVDGVVGPIASAAVGGVVPVEAGAVGVALVADGLVPVCMAPFGPTEVGAVGVACGVGTLLVVLGLLPFIAASTGEAASNVAARRVNFGVFITKSLSKNITIILPFLSAINIHRDSLYFSSRYNDYLRLLLG